METLQRYDDGALAGADAASAIFPRRLLASARVRRAGAICARTAARQSASARGVGDVLRRRRSGQKRLKRVAEKSAVLGHRGFAARRVLALEDDLRFDAILSRCSCFLPGTPEAASDVALDEERRRILPKLADLQRRLIDKKAVGACSTQAGGGRPIIALLAGKQEEGRGTGSRLPAGAYAMVNMAGAHGDR